MDPNKTFMVISAIFLSIGMILVLVLMSWSAISKLIGLSFIKRIWCRFNKHSFVYKKYGQNIKKYKCLHCDATRKHPLLKLVDNANKKVNNS